MERLTSPNINVDPGTDRFLHATIGGKEIDWKQSRDSTLNVLINSPTSNGFGKDIFRKMARDLYGRLKAYEDTGLEPEAVETVKLALAAKHIDEHTLRHHSRVLAIAYLALEAETTQIIDGCCTACGAFMDCCEAAEYKYCPYCAKRIV